MIKELTKYIADGGIGFTRDTNLFAGFRPAEAPARCVAVLESSGGTVDSYLPDVGEKLVEVLSRAESYWDARADIYVVFEFLKSKAQVTLPVVTAGTTFTAQFIEAVNFPQSLQQDEEGRWEFSANFIIRLRKS